MIPLKRIAAKWKLNNYYRAMLDHYQEIMNFSWEYVYPKVGLFGAKLPNGTWDGIIGELQTGDADITGVGHSQLPVRFEVSTMDDTIMLQTDRNSERFHNCYMFHY